MLDARRKASAGSFGNPPMSNLRTAKEALMLADSQKLLAQSNAVVNAHWTNHLPGFKPPADEMINVGDQNTAIHNYPAPPVPAPSALGTAAKLGLAAALVATGIGVPVGAWILADAIKNIPAAAAPPPAKPSTDTWFEIDLIPPERN